MTAGVQFPSGRFQLWRSFAQGEFINSPCLSRDESELDRSSRSSASWTLHLQMPLTIRCASFLNLRMDPIRPPSMETTVVEVSLPLAYLLYAR